MSDSGRAGGHASPTSLAAMLSPLVKPLPNGYRDIQPFRKGQGWHSNGRTKRAKPSTHQFPSVNASGSPYRSPDRVVLPLIQCYEAGTVIYDRLGPNASAVDAGSDQEDHDNDGDEPRQVGIDERLNENDQSSPHSEDPVVSIKFHSVTPQHAWKSAATPPSAPRRPSSVGYEAHGSAIFRTRAVTSASLAGSAMISNNASSDSRPNTPSAPNVATTAEPRTKDIAVQSSLGERSKRPSGPRSIADLVSSDDGTPPDPILVQQLWQEFNERAQAQRAVDRDEYHRKMQRKYNERKALREQVAQLGRTLADTRKERDNLQQQLRIEPTDCYEEVEIVGSVSPGPSPHWSPVPSPRLSPRGVIAPSSEFGYRERSFQLERALANTKQQLVDTEEELSKRQSVMQSKIDDLEARLELESRVNATLSRQLRETSSSLQATADELVSTRVELEREIIARQADHKESRERMQELLAQHRQDLVVTNSKQALRNLGRQALQNKVKAFHSRAMVAEQRMRVAQEQVMQLCQEVQSKQQSLERVMSAEALGSAPLLSASGTAGCHRNVLFHGTKNISGRAFVLHVVCNEDALESSADDKEFGVHFVAFDPVSGQHDYLAFRLVDIRRLVPNSHAYLEKDELGRRQRLSDLSALLLPYVNAGFKAGRLVLHERASMTSTMHCDHEGNCIETPVIREATVYRGTRFIECLSDRSLSTDTIMADLTVNEVFSTQSPEQWWIEIHAVLLDSLVLNGLENEDMQDEHILKIDSNQLVALCNKLEGYRPTDRLEKLPLKADKERNELMSVHEAILQPLLESLRIFISGNATVRLDISGGSNSSEMVPVASIRALPSPEQLQEPTAEQNSAAGNDTASSATASINITGRTLDHRCIVNVGGVFYCARYLEVWDDELLLEITLDDPESTVRVTGKLREHQLAAIATFLHTRGAVMENFTPHMGFGLPAELQAPLCKLLTRHLRRSRIGRHSQLAVTFNSLFQEIGFADDGTSARGGTISHDDNAATSFEPAVVAPASDTETGDGSSPIFVLGCCGVLSEHQIHDLVLQTKTPKASRLRERRRGVRLRRENGRSELALVQIFDGFNGFDGVVAAIHPLSLLGGTNEARVVVVSEPFGPQAFELLSIVIHRAE